MAFKLSNSTLLKVAIFATGCSGIVAEYVLATLATYFLGNQLVQWTLIISIMLFAMGLGSRLSRNMNEHLLEKFIGIEIVLSLLVSFSAIIVYATSAFSQYTGVLIYSLSIAVGLLIGLEIPLVTRINSEYESLKFNISSVMEKDYFGSLIGGIFFAFIGLRFFGLSYTPILLGSVNLFVAIILYVKLKPLVGVRFLKVLPAGLGVSVLLLAAGALMAEKATLFGDQSRHRDKVIYSEQTQYQKITLTQWKNDYWLYLNHNQQLATIDEFMYHEPLVHPIMALTKAKEVLIIGGGDGCAVKELLKYPFVESVTLVDLDPAMTQLAMTHEVFLKMNEGALSSPKTTVINDDGKRFLENSDKFYDAIIIDLPDPKTVELSMLYSKEFYELCGMKLRPNGAIITQAGSPYYATRAFYGIEKTMKKAGFNTAPMQNQVLTMGQWGWILGQKNRSPEDMQQYIRQSMESEAMQVPTKWLTIKSLDHVFSFGKPLADTTGIEVNSLQNPVLYQSYLQGNWDLY